MESKLQKTSYKLQLINSAGFMASLLSNLFDNLVKGVHEIKCKNGYDRKYVKNVELNTKYSACSDDDKLCMWIMESMHMLGIDCLICHVFM